MKSCIIIGASPCKKIGFLSDEIVKNSFVFAADGGYATAQRENIKVDAFVGDMDSSKLSPNCADITILPCEKDYSDVHTAVNRALSDGFKTIYLVGCTNGRADHYFANVALLEMISKQGAEGVIVDEVNKIRFISEGKYIFKRCAKYFAILALDERISGVTLKGLKYPLSDACIYRDMPIGISNEWIEDSATIEIKKGRALLIFSEDDVI